VAWVNGLGLAKNSTLSSADKRAKISYVKSIDSLALAVGLFGHILGLISGLDTIEAMQSVSPFILAVDLKISLISALYGFFIFIVSNIFYLLLSLMLRVKE